MVEIKKRADTCRSAISYAEEFGEGGYEVMNAIAAAFRAWKEIEAAKTKTAADAKPETETEPKAG